MHHTITTAAALIAEIDPALAAAFRAQRFQRHNIISALHASMSNCYLAPLADAVAVALRSAVDADAAPLIGD